MNKEQFQKELKCIIGTCSHRPDSPVCVFTKIVLAKDPNVEMEKRTMKLLDKFIRKNTRKPNVKKQTTLRTKM